MEVYLEFKYLSDMTLASIRRIIAASSVGTMIEWYDFYIFGMLAKTISLEFFPADNPTAALLSTLAIFAAGFIVRPFGALVFGRLGDKVGRKYTFLLTLILMGGSTFLIGCVPGYKSIGILAPILVLLLRLIQGLALGGEYGGAATYVAEHAPVGKRGLYTSWIQTTATLGLFVALGVILLVKSNMSEAAFTAEWGGWRFPFWISLLLVGVSVYIRLNMSESPLFAELKSSGKTAVNPLKESFQQRANFKLVLLALFGAVMGEGVVWYTGQFYAQSFLETKCKLDFEQSRTILLWAIAAATPFFVFFGWLSDRIGRKWILMTGMLLAVLTYRPIFGYFIDHSIALDPTATTIVLTSDLYWKFVGLVFLLIFYVTMVYGPIAAFLVEMFPAKIRYSSMSLPYHIGNGVFGGLVPFIATLISSFPGSTPLSGLWYPIGIASISLIIGVFYLSNKIDENVAD